jgi:hypothetical protein
MLVVEMNLGAPRAAFARGVFDFGFDLYRARQRNPAITAERNKVEIAASIVALQILRHDRANPRAHV